MVKLSKQVSDKYSTRTQRVAQKQEVERREKKAQADYDALKQKVDLIKKTQFVDKTKTETYEEVIPKRFDVNDYTRSKWYKKSSHVRDRWLKNASKHNYKGAWAVNRYTRTREVTVPFTLEDGENSYKSVYETLSPDVKQFFQTPEEVLQSKSTRIQTTRSTIQDKLSYADQKIAEARQKHEEKIRKNDAWYRGKSSTEREKIRDRYKKKDRRYDDDLEEEIAKWQGYKKGLGKGLNELDQNKDIAIDDIERYAYDVADYEERKREVRNENREFNYKQKQEIKKLEEAGYKPFVVEKSSKGKTEEAYLTFINTELGKSKQVAKFKPITTVNVKTLQPSKLGSVPISRSLEYAGKEYKFSSNLQLYKDDQGKLKTEYGDIGLTEKQVIDQARDQAYSEWQDKNKTNFSSDFKVLTIPQKTDSNKNFWREIEGYAGTGELPYGYGGQQSISTEPTSVLISSDQYYAIQDQASFFQWATKSIKKLTGKIPKIKQGEWFLNVGSPVGINTFQTGIAPYKTSDDPFKSISITEGIQTTREDLGDLGEKIKQWALGSDKIKKVEEDLKDQYQKRYQTAFEKKYMKDLIYEDIGFDEASAEFEKSREAEIIQRDYAKEYGEEMARLNSEVKTGKKILGYAGAGSLSLISGAYGLIETPKKTVLTAGAVYGGLKVVKYIPKIAGVTFTGYMGASGLKKALSPTSTFEEASSGFVQAVISGAVLGYAGYKYWKQPVVTSENIKVPIKEFQKAKVIGFQGKTKTIVKIRGETYAIDNTYFGKQKLSTQIIEGRRTIVTTKGRSLLNKYLNYDMTGLKLDPIYKGVPYVDKAGYTKAFKRLRSYGLSEAQAKATLRYHQPKVIETTLEKGQITTIQGDKISATGQFDISRSQPKIIIDKDLGISTRYAKTKTDLYDFERYLTNIGGKDLVVTDIMKTSPYAPLGKTTTLFKEFSTVKVEDLQKGLIQTGYSKNIKVLQEYKYQDIKSLFVQKQTLPLKRSLELGSSQTRIIRANQNIVDIDFDEITGVFKSNALQPANIKKTPLSKTFGVDEAKNLFSVRSEKDLNKVISKLEESGSVGITGRSTGSTSQYAGTGMYERSAGGLLPQEFKSLPLSDLSLTNKINMGKIVLPTSSLGLKTGLFTSVGVASVLKSQEKLKTNFKTNFELKDLIKSKTDFGLKSQVAPKQDLSLKSSSILKSQLINFGLGLNITSPVIRPPTIPTFNFRPPIIVLPFSSARIKKKISKKKKGIYELGYLPDFTSRAIGLDPEIITEKQALAKVKKIQTGFELRRGVILK